MRVSLKDNIAPSFYRVHNLLKTAAYHQYWFSGGRGSTKSSFIAIQIIHEIMKDPEANGIAFRKYTNTIRNSIYSTLLWAIYTLGVEHKFKGTVAPFEITYLETGQKIILLGLDDPKKIKSIKIKDGYFKILWFEELEEYNGMEEIRSVQQSVLRGGETFIEFLSYNPPRDPQAWVNKEKKAINEDRYIHHSTYLDVPPEWNGSRFVADAERLKEADDDLYQHEYMGLAIGLTERVIFNKKYVIQPFEPEDWWSPLFGADWGFANDPNVLVKMWIAPHDDYGDNCLYIEYAEYGYRVDNKDIPDMYDRIPGSRKYMIRADNARPETISYIAGKGFNVIAADKWPGSVEDGITFIRSFDKIIIHTRCEEMAEEARLYSYKIDKVTKDILPDIVKKFDHGWDSVRYALSKMIKNRMIGFTEKQKRDNNKRAKTTIAPAMDEKSW